MSSLDQNTFLDELGKINPPTRMIASAKHAASTCLGTNPSDSVVLIYDNTTRAIAAALLGAFAEISRNLKLFNLDSFGPRPLPHPPGVVLNALEQGTVSAMAISVMRGEISVRRAILGVVAAKKLRHAHMPAISEEVFVDGLSVDYTEVARFVSHLQAVVAKSSSVKAVSSAGTELVVRYADPSHISCFDGIISKESWQNLPSGQLIIEPETADGIFVVDNVIGDWFEEKYDVTEQPVVLEFEKGRVRNMSCENHRLERDLSIFLRSSTNSDRISELVIGANLRLKNRHKSILYQHYRPGVAVSVGKLPGMSIVGKVWSSKTFLPVLGRNITLTAGEDTIMVDDTFVAPLISTATGSKV